MAYIVIFVVRVITSHHHFWVKYLFIIVRLVIVVLYNRYWTITISNSKKLSLIKLVS